LSQCASVDERSGEIYFFHRILDGPPKLDQARYELDLNIEFSLLQLNVSPANTNRAALYLFCAARPGRVLLEARHRIFRSDKTSGPNARNV